MTDRKQLTARLQAQGHAVTAHNLACEEFAVALENAGGTHMLDTVCYEGSEADLEKSPKGRRI